jgi:hypothetical protein
MIAVGQYLGDTIGDLCKYTHYHRMTDRYSESREIVVLVMMCDMLAQRDTYSMEDGLYRSAGNRGDMALPYLPYFLQIYTLKRIKKFLGTPPPAKAGSFVLRSL